MNIEIHIDRLILDGLPLTGQSGPQIQAAVEAELTRLLTEGGLAAELQAGGGMRSLKADDFQMGRDANSSQLGWQIAQALYGGIGQSRDLEQRRAQPHERGSV